MSESQQSVVSSVESRWPIVGQDASVLEIRAHFRSTSPPSFVIVGLSGTGKTSLLRTVADQAGDAGLDVIAIHGVQSNPSIALAPLLPLLPPEAPADADSAMLYRLLVTQLTNGRQRLITVDDAHLLDPASAAAVNAIAQSRSALMVVTVRSDLPAHGSVVALWKDDLSSRIDLGTLTRDQCQRVLEHALGVVEDTVVDEAWRLSDGSPLFLHELTLDAIESGSLTFVEGTWRLRDQLTASLRVHDVVDRRLGSLSDAQIDTLSALSLREQLDYAILERLGFSEHVLDLERRGLVRRSTDGRRRWLELGHPLYSQVLSDRLPSTQRVDLLVNIANAIREAGGRRLTDPLLVATCLIDADHPLDPDELLRAADRALALFDYDLAESLATAGFDGGHIGCGLTLYRALNGQRSYAAADRIHEQLLRLASSPDERALVYLAAAGAMLQQRADLDGSTRHRDAGLAEEPSDEIRMQLTVYQLITAFVDGHHGRARQLLRTLPEPDQLPAMASASLASHAAGVNLLRGDFGAALDHVANLRALEQSLGRVGWLDRERTDFAETACLAARFEPIRAQHVARLSVEAAQALSVEGTAITLLGEQYAAWLGGHTSKAWMAYHQWHEAVAISTDRLAERAGHLFGALTAFDRGDEAGLALCVERLQLSSPLGNVAVVQAILSSRKHQMENDHAAAVRSLRRPLDFALQNEGYHFAALAARDLITLGEVRSAVEVLETVLASTPQEWVASWWLEQAHFLIAGDKSGLIGLATKFGETGYLLDAAHTAGFAASLTPSPLERFILLTRARRWLDAGQAVSEQVEAVTPPVSPREGEIILAAARGLSNGEIANAFVISPRTAANHLHRGYQKLGLARGDLAEAFAEFTDVEPGNNVE